MKSPEIMTLEEVAEYLRVSERTVYDWANKGTIPCGKLGTTWRFKRSDIEAWVDQQLSPSEPKRDFTPLFVGNVLRPERVIVIDKMRKAALLDKMINLLDGAPEIKSITKLREGIFHREQLMSTGIGMGIAIPHVRLRSVSDIVMTAALVRYGVPDYISMDSEPVQLVFMIVARDDQHVQHLKLLSQISARLKEKEYRMQLLECETAEQFYKLLTARSA